MPMKRRLHLGCLALIASAFTASAAVAAPKKILVVTITMGFRHGSIETAEKVIAELGKSSGLYAVELAAVTPTEGPGYGEKIKAVLAEKAKPAALGKYDAIVFANTTGDLPLPDKAALIQWVKDGGAFIGVHSASDTLHGYPPYFEMLGGEFDYHREQVVIEGINKDAAHPANRHLGETWNLQGRKEEIYVFKNYQRNSVHELIVLNRHPNSGEPGNFPISWCRSFGNGRVFYTALGHNDDVWQTHEFQKHILGGIEWALRLNEGSAMPPSK